MTNGPAMRDGHSSELVESWVDRLHGDFATTVPHEARQEAAYAQWFDQVAQRRDGRRERLAEAAPFLAMPMWFALGIGAMLTLAYMVVQADKRESLVIQAIPIGFAAAIITTGLLVVVFPENPFAGANGSIKPLEMSRTLARIDNRLQMRCERGKPYLAVPVLGASTFCATNSAAVSVNPSAGYMLCALLSAPPGEQTGSSGMHTSAVFPE